MVFAGASNCVITVSFCVQSVLSNTIFKKHYSLKKLAVTQLSGVGLGIMFCSEKQFLISWTFFPRFWKCFRLAFPVQYKSWFCHMESVISSECIGTIRIHKLHGGNLFFFFFFSLNLFATQYEVVNVMIGVYSGRYLSKYPENFWYVWLSNPIDSSVSQISSIGIMPFTTEINIWELRCRYMRIQYTCVSSI